MATAATGAGWNFDNTYVHLPDSFYTRLEPTPVRAPKLVVFNEPLAAQLGLRSEALRGEAGAAVFGGNEVPPGGAPLAQAYAGHQFGGFTRLGDGRAHLLGEHVTPTGERFDIQLKGSGPTPYSRGGDGRAALGPMLREYIISEALHGLGIPTTRSLAVVTTGERIARDELLPGAVLTRVAASHLRVGTFQYVAFYLGDAEKLRALADYALARHFPAVDLEDPARFLQLLRLVMERQARLIARWQLVGFIHGVMNTDNVTISGETIDYGPCAFMDTYDPATVFSSIDRNGRYAYGRQPPIGLWNLARFAEALLPLLHDDEKQAITIAEETLADFSTLYEDDWRAGMQAKLGLADEEPGDEELIAELLRLMEIYAADYTNTFRSLTLGQPELTPMHGATAWEEWYARWQTRLERQAVPAERLMRRANPAIIPRNHRVEEALAAAVDDDDLTVMEQLLDVLVDPFAYRAEQEAYTAPAASTSHPYVTYCGT